MKPVWIFCLLIYLTVYGTNGQINSNQGRVAESNSAGQQQNGLTKDWPMGPPPAGVQVPNTNKP